MSDELSGNKKVIDELSDHRNRSITWITVYGFHKKMNHGPKMTTLRLLIFFNVDLPRSIFCIQLIHSMVHQCKFQHYGAEYCWLVSLKSTSLDQCEGGSIFLVSWAILSSKRVLRSVRRQSRYKAFSFEREYGKSVQCRVDLPIKQSHVDSMPLSRPKIE